jgi:hypothetical protein
VGEVGDERKMATVRSARQATLAYHMLLYQSFCATSKWYGVCLSHVLPTVDTNMGRAFEKFCII